MCRYCKEPIYIKVTKYAKSMLAPLTVEGELRQRLEDLTAEQYSKVEKRFCPVCGAEVEE